MSKFKTLLSLLLFKGAVASWTIVGQYKYNIKDTLTNNEVLPYEEAKEVCEFLGKNSRLFEPDYFGLFRMVMNDVKLQYATTPTDSNIWINALRGSNNSFYYAGSGTTVDADEAPWASDEPNNALAGEGCVETNMEGKWNDIKCTNENLALCQAPLEWTQIGDYFYLLNDSLSQGTKTFAGALNLCRGLSDDESDVKMFEPRTLEEQSAVLESIAPWIKSLGTPPKFWINAITSGDGHIYLSDSVKVPDTFWRPGNRFNPFVMLDSSDGKWEDVDLNNMGYTICQVSTKIINPNCEDVEGMGKYKELNTKEQMLNALDYFCKLDEDFKDEFIACPQVSNEAEYFFSLAKAVGCSSKEDLMEYLVDGCDFICQKVKAKGFEKLKEAQKTTDSFYARQVSELDTSLDYWSVTVSTLESLSGTYAEYKEFAMSKDVDGVKEDFLQQIEDSDLSEEEKEKLRKKVDTAIDTASVFQSSSAYNAVQGQLSSQIVIAESKVEEVEDEKAKVVKKKGTLSKLYSECKVNLKGMTSVELVSKGTESIGHISTGVQKLIGAKGDWKQILSGTLDLVNALSVFLPPPVTSLTSTVSEIYNLFLGGGSPDTATLIQKEFEKQTAMILDQFERIRFYINKALDLQTLEEMKVLAQGVLADLSTKLMFVDSFRDESMSEDLAREIKNEIQTFQHNTDITRFRLTFDEYCKDFFSNYYVYATNTDLKTEDQDCLFLAYTYIMIEVTGKSVMTSMINKLSASGSEYLNELNKGFLTVQQFKQETTKNWLWKLFQGKGHVICAAFKFDTSMWSDSDQKELALLYIGSIDADLKTYIEHYDCQGSVDAAQNFVHIESQLIEKKGREVTLNNWGKGFIVDFFLAYSVCKGGGTAKNGKWFKADYCEYVATCADPECKADEKECLNDAPPETKCIKEKNFSFGSIGRSLAYDHSILHVTNGKKKTLGYYAPSVVMRKHDKIGIYMPKSDEWDYRKDYSFGFDNGPGKQTWHHITISQLEEEGDSTQENYKMSVRVDGNLIVDGVTNNLGSDFSNVKAYISSPDTNSLGSNRHQKFTLDQHSVHNLRFINRRQRYVLKLGNKIYTIRIGPATLTEAQAFCKAEGQSLYKPTYEAIHKLIYQRVSEYGVTTFWTQAKYEFKTEGNVNTGTINWIPKDSSTVPTWIYNQWKHTYGLYHRKGACVAVGFNDRGYQLTAVDCTKEVADTVCQPA